MKNFSRNFWMTFFVIVGIVSIYNTVTYSEADRNRDYENNPIVSNPDNSDCRSDGIIGALCNATEGLSNLADRVNEKMEIAKESRANPDNQYDTLEECLKDDSLMVEYTTREDWCESFYVLIKDK